jgi:hypothetical protein
MGLLASKHQGSRTVSQYTDRLCRVDRDADTVLGGAIQRGLRPREVDLLWKLLGYQAGPHVLNAMTGHISNPIWANRAEDALAYFQDTAINVTKKKDAVGVTNMKHLPPLDTCAAELQSDALMFTAVGMEIPGAEFLKQLRFPKQVTKT